MGPYDQTDIEKRADVLVYSTPPLSEPVAVTGPITVKLHAASSAPDTDWTAKLVDVHPDGKIINLNNGIIRASKRNALDRSEPIEPGKIYEYTITVFPTSNLFKAGHEIRLEIASSNFPHYDRNLNTGARVGEDAQMVVARQTVYHDLSRPSHVVLPIMPAPRQDGGTITSNQPDYVPKALFRAYTDQLGSVNGASPGASRMLVSRMFMRAARSSE